MLVPASFKLALMCYSCMHHLLSWVASCSLVMHHTWLSIMSCLCVECLPWLFASFRLCSFSLVPVSLRSWGFVRLRLVRLIHGLVLHPSGISGKMTVTLDLIAIIAMLVASFYRYVALPITCSSSLPKLPCQPLTFSPFLANRCLAMLPLLLSPFYSVVSCRWSWRLLHGGQGYVGISQYLLLN